MNNITIELCAEDRARIDRLTDLLSARINQAERIMASSYEAERIMASSYEADPDPEQITSDDVQKKLAETLAKANDPTDPPKNAPEEAKAEAAPIDHPAEEELPWATDPAEKKAEPTVTLEQIQQKVVQLAAGQGGAKKAKVREIINTYGAKVSDLKDQPDKWDEVWSKLTALESEG